MKTTNTLLVATVTAIATLFITQARAQNASAGADSVAASPKTRQMLDDQKRWSRVMTPITSTQDVTGLKDGDMIAMACPKCKTITITYVHTEKGKTSADTTLGHACPGCEQKFVVVGEGKEKHNIVTHVCKACGSTDAFCCAMKKESQPTKGMEDVPKDKKN